MAGSAQGARPSPRASPLAPTFLPHHFQDVRVAHLRQLVNDTVRRAASYRPQRRAGRSGADTESDLGQRDLRLQFADLRGYFPRRRLHRIRALQAAGLLLQRTLLLHLLCARGRPLRGPLPGALLGRLPAPSREAARLLVRRPPRRVLDFPRVLCSLALAPLPFLRRSVRLSTSVSSPTVRGLVCLWKEEVYYISHPGERVTACHTGSQGGKHHEGRR